jgi:tyrosine-protein kinase Etk/Wzc
MPEKKGGTIVAGHAGEEYFVEEKAITFIDILSVLIKRRWLIIGSTLTAAVLIVIFSLLTLLLPPDSPLNVLPNQYSPAVTIIIEESTGSLASRLASSSGALASLLGGAAAVNPNIELAQKLLTGNTLQDKIIEEFALVERYRKVNSKYPQSETRESFIENLGIGTGENPAGPGNIISIRFRDIDPVFAYHVVSRIEELLSERFKTLTLEKVRTKRAFIEERLATVEEEMRIAREALEEFQLAYGIIDISSQAKEQANIMAGLQADVIRSELELQTLRDYLSEDNAKIVILRREIGQKNKLIEELKSGFKEFSGELIPQNRIPELTNQFLTLRGELETQRKIYTTLRQEFEMVKLEEADNTTTFQVIEPAEVLERKTGPFRSFICMFVTIAAFVLACVLAFVKEYFDNARQNPVEARKLQEISESFRRRRKRIDRQGT